VLELEPDLMFTPLQPPPAEATTPLLLAPRRPVDAAISKMPFLVEGRVGGREALWAASLAGDDAKAQALLDAGTLADEPDCSDGDRTALHIASRAGHLKVVRALMGGGAEVNKAAAGGETPLCTAVAAGHLQVCRALIEGGAHICDRTYGFTLLHLAAAGSNSIMVQLLVVAGADVKAVESSSGSTALHVAAEEGCLEAVRVLVAAGADAQTGNANGQTPRQLAIEARRNRWDEVAQLLLSLEASVIDQDQSPAEHEVEPSELKMEPSEPEMEPSEPKMEFLELEMESSEPVAELTELEIEPVEPEMEPFKPEMEPFEPEVEPLEPVTVEVHTPSTGLSDKMPPAQGTKTVQRLTTPRGVVSDKRPPAHGTTTVQRLTSPRGEVSDKRPPTQGTKTVQRLTTPRGVVSDKQPPTQGEKTVQRLTAPRGVVTDKRPGTHGTKTVQRQIPPKQVRDQSARPTRSVPLPNSRLYPRKPTEPISAASAISQISSAQSKQSAGAFQKRMAKFERISRGIPIPPKKDNVWQRLAKAPKPPKVEKGKESVWEKGARILTPVDRLQLGLKTMPDKPKPGTYSVDVFENRKGNWEKLIKSEKKKSKMRPRSAPASVKTPPVGAKFPIPMSPGYGRSSPSAMKDNKPATPSNGLASGSLQDGTSPRKSIRDIRLMFDK